MKRIVVLTLILLLNNVYPADSFEKVKLLHQLTNLTISEDTTWSGVVDIRGIVVVKKGARLSIVPGTEIRFTRIDVDEDGIGDGELIVEGSLTAIGTRSKPIIFTSAAAKKNRRDWKFIMVNFSADTQLEYCVIEYAFSAVQIHFSKAVIRNCSLRHCEDGLRFSTADLVLEHNRISDNVYGIRYEERGSQARMQFNNITDNDYGIFCVSKSEDRAKIRNNNIYNNRKYNLLMGAKQAADISLPDNFWGDSDPVAAMEKIFAKNYETSLGAVNILPLQNTLIQEAGIK